MTSRRNRLVPIEWDPGVVALLSEIAPDDVEGAKVWWESHAPILYAGVMDALSGGDSRDLREDDIRRIIQDLARDERLTPAQRDWKKAGLLLVFIGGSYYTLRGHQVPLTVLGNSMNKALAGHRPNVQGMCNQLRNGDLSLRDWQLQMKAGIISSQIAGGMLASGGEAGLAPDKMNIIQEHIAFQLSHLANFAKAIAGGMALDGTVCRLMKMYINSARGTFYAIDGVVKSGYGFTLYRNVLGAGETHCTGGGSCPEVSDQGYQPVGTLTPIGARKCMSNCLCHWQYMNPVTEEVW